MISTPIFYVNSRTIPSHYYKAKKCLGPHIGHAYSIILADAIARWKGIQAGTGPKLVTTGTDEHGDKVLEASRAQGMEPKAFCDGISAKFRDLTGALGVSTFSFNRTTDPEHKAKVLELWRRLEANGAIYKGEHTGWYCTSEEAFIPEGKLKVIDGTKRVTADTGKAVQMFSQVTYKFRLSEYISRAAEWIERDRPVYPEGRANDLREALAEGLPDLSISRSVASNPWGIPVPGDPSQTIYVWLDALSNYISGGSISEEHVIGKDILKFHAIYWPAFLMAAGLPLPQRIVTHGHWIVGREKMSKSLGNVVDPFEAIRKYSADGLRFLLLRLGRIDADSEYSEDAFGKRYNLDLANNLGNLVSRLRNPQFYAKLEMSLDNLSASQRDGIASLKERVAREYDAYRFHVALEEIMSFLGTVNTQVNLVKPWEAAKAGRQEEVQAPMAKIVLSLAAAVELLEPVMPTFSKGIASALNYDSRALNLAGFLHSGVAKFPRLINH